MLRRSVFLFCVALVIALATSSKAQAWGCYRAAGFSAGGYGGYRAGAVGGYRAGAVGGFGGCSYGAYGGYRAGYVRRW